MFSARTLANKQDAGRSRYVLGKQLSCWIRSGGIYKKVSFSRRDTDDSLSVGISSFSFLIALEYISEGHLTYDWCESWTYVSVSFLLPWLVKQHCVLWRTLCSFTNALGSVIAYLGSLCFPEYCARVFFFFLLKEVSVVWTLQKVCREVMSLDSSWSLHAGVFLFE